MFPQIACSGAGGRASRGLENCGRAALRLRRQAAVPRSPDGVRRDGPTGGRDRHRAREQPSSTRRDAFSATPPQQIRLADCLLLEGGKVELQHRRRRSRRGGALRRGPRGGTGRESQCNADGGRTRECAAARVRSNYRAWRRGKGGKAPGQPSAGARQNADAWRVRDGAARPDSSGGDRRGRDGQKETYIRPC
jgi:hypothetical protein